MNPEKKCEILKNLHYIRDLSLSYYKKHNIVFKEPPEPFKTPFPYFFGKVQKRRATEVPSIKKRLSSPHN